MLNAVQTLSAVQLRDIADDAARTAGEYLATVFRGPMEIHHKTSAHDQVTVHDSAAEALIRQIITERCPGSTVVGEETGVALAGQDQNGTDWSHVVWHVDPIDGTSNFAQGLAFFCTAIAVEIDGEIRAGAVYDPMADLLFSADDDAAYLNGEILITPETLPVPSATLITGYPTAADLAAEGPTAMERLHTWVDTFSSVRRTGSGALSIAHVAAGWTDASLGTGVSTWDVAAAMLILRRAGGTYRALRYSGVTGQQPDHYAPGYLASGPGANYQVLEVAADQIENTRP